MRPPTSNDRPVYDMRPPKSNDRPRILENDRAMMNEDNNRRNSRVKRRYESRKVNRRLRYRN
jgi:hypothetical protein